MSILLVLRGISRAVAATTGLLLIYGTIYAMDGMTTRLPIAPVHELAYTTLCMLPWTLLFCSGTEDLEIVTRQRWIFWMGVVLALAFLYNFEHHTASKLITKMAMPLLASLAGALPHIFRRIYFLFKICSLVAGVAGLVTLYFILHTIFFSLSYFATKTIAFVIVAFTVTSISSAALSFIPIRAHIRPLI